MSTTKAQAQEATGFYFSRLSPHMANHVNIRNFLKTPLLNVTLKVLQKENKSELNHRQNARMEAFLTGCTLAVPTAADSSSEKEEKDDFLDNGLSLPASTASPTAKLLTYQFISPTKNKLPQIPKQDLILRLELYIHTLALTKKQEEECVINLENAKILKIRARLVTKAFVATAGCVRSISATLTKLLNCLSMEVLAIETLAEDLVKVIRRIVLEYEHGTSFASLAFLSTPEGNAASLLMPLIMNFFGYLQKHHHALVENCELERIHTLSIDREMRTLFKTVEFQSIGHLLEICHEQKHKLSNIQLAPKDKKLGSHEAEEEEEEKELRQALKDLQREVITVNGHVLPPFLSKKDLIHLLTQTLNSGSLTALTHRKFYRKRSTRKKRQQQQQDLDLSLSELSSTSDTPTTNEEDSSQSPRKRHHRRGANRFHGSTIGLLTKRLLIASSRTGNGGDAYFVVRDLFGGEDVEVVPSTQPREQMVRPGTMDILVRMASVTIKCYQSFDVYPKDLVGECHEPLIQFHTTTTETIYLREVRSPQTEINDDSSNDDEDLKKRLLVVEEQNTGKTGWRTISIRPAMYEKVEVWNTPS